MNAVSSQVLHHIEDATVRGQGVHVRTLVSLVGKSETTVRKCVNELADGGFVRRRPLATSQWEAVSKHEDTGGEVNSTSPTKARKTTKKSNGTGGRGRPADPQVQARDAQALELVVKAKDQGVTKADLATALGVTPGIAYISIWRLTHAGKIRKVATGSRTPKYVAS